MTERTPLARPACSVTPYVRTNVVHSAAPGPQPQRCAPVQHGDVDDGPPDVQQLAHPHQVGAHAGVLRHGHRQQRHRPRAPHAASTAVAASRLPLRLLCRRCAADKPRPGQRRLALFKHRRRRLRPAAAAAAPPPAEP